MCSEYTAEWLRRCVGGWHLVAMSSFAILRVRKHKALASLSGVGRHHCRQSNARGADPLKASKNITLGAAKGGARAAVSAVRAVLDDAQAKSAKAFRRDGVKVVEYLLTASPEWWAKASPKYRAAFFDRARRWLRDKHGAGNVVAEWVHLDERSPHLHAWVVPLHEGRPNARHFLGGAAKLEGIQDEFAALMQPLGLQRGIRKSKGEHLPVADWWATLDKPGAKPSRMDYARKAAGLPSPKVDHAERQAVGYVAQKRAFERLRAREATSSKAAADNALDAAFLASERQRLTKRDAEISATVRENLRLRERVAELERGALVRTPAPVLSYPS